MWPYTLIRWLVYLAYVSLFIFILNVIASFSHDFQNNYKTIERKYIDGEDVITETIGTIVFEDKFFFSDKPFLEVIFNDKSLNLDYKKCILVLSGLYIIAWIMGLMLLVHIINSIVRFIEQWDYKELKESLDRSQENCDELGLYCDDMSGFWDHYSRFLDSKVIKTTLQKKQIQTMGLQEKCDIVNAIKCLVDCAHETKPDNYWIKIEDSHIFVYFTCSKFKEEQRIDVSREHDGHKEQLSVCSWLICEIVSYGYLVDEQFKKPSENDDDDDSL